MAGARCGVVVIAAKLAFEPWSARWGSVLDRTVGDAWGRGKGSESVRFGFGGASAASEPMQIFETKNIPDGLKSCFDTAIV